jgi:hypothetical protein
MERHIGAQGLAPSLAESVGNAAKPGFERNAFDFLRDGLIEPVEA